MSDWWWCICCRTRRHRCRLVYAWKSSSSVWPTTICSLTTLRYVWVIDTFFHNFGNGWPILAASGVGECFHAALNNDVFRECVRVRGWWIVETVSRWRSHGSTGRVSTVTLVLQQSACDAVCSVNPSQRLPILTWRSVYIRNSLIISALDSRAVHKTPVFSQPVCTCIDVCCSYCRPSPLLTSCPL